MQLFDDVNNDIANISAKNNDFVRKFTPEESARGLNNTGIDGLTQDQINVLNEVDF